MTSILRGIKQIDTKLTINEQADQMNPKYDYKFWDEMTPKEKMSSANYGRGVTVFNQKTQKYSTKFPVLKSESIQEAIDINDDDWYEINPNTNTVVMQRGPQSFRAPFGQREIKLPNGNIVMRGMSLKTSGLDKTLKLKQEPLSEEEQLDEDLRKWFKEKWVRFGPDGKIRGDCARGDDSEGKPKCLPQSKAQNLGKKGRASAASRKRREDPNPERSGKAINVDTKKKSNEGVVENVRNNIMHAWNAGMEDNEIIQKFGMGAYNSLKRKYGDKSIPVPDLIGYKVKEPTDRLTRIHRGLDGLGKQLKSQINKNKEQGVAETTGDKPFDSMMTNIIKGTKKQTTADRREKQRQSQERARNAFGPSPADALGVKKGVAEAGNKPVEKSYFGMGDTRTPRDIKSQMRGASDNFVKSTADTATGPIHSRVAKMQAKMAKSELRKRSDHDRMATGTNEGVAEGFDKEAEAYKAHLLKTAPKVMDFLSKAVKGWRPSEEEMLGAIDTGYIVMKHTGDVKQAGKAMMDELNTLHRMSQGQQGVTEEQLDELKCWPGYHRVAGTKAGFPGSCAKNKTNEENIAEDSVPFDQCPHCRGPIVHESMLNEKQDACYHKVKSRYKVWPSAYASGALVQCRKKGASNWGNKSEGVAEDSMPYPHGKPEAGDKITWYHSNNYPEIEGTVVGWKDGHLIVKSIDPSPRNTEKTVAKYRVPKNNILSVEKQGVTEDQLDEKWSQKYKSSINCSNPKGFSQKAHCAGKKKNESAILTGLQLHESK